MVKCLYFLILLIFNILAPLEAYQKVNQMEDNNFPLERFHVCTIATYAHPNLDKLLLSCHNAHIELDVLGMGQPSYQHWNKFIYISDYLSTLPDRDIVMFVDAFDVLITADKSEILRKFRSMKIPFLMTAETNCYPYQELAALYPRSPTKFKYINSGSYIGYVKTLKSWLANLSPIDHSQCDQGQISRNYIDFPQQRLFKLDYHCQMFLPLYGVEEEEVVIEPNRVRCTITNSFPCLVHANGGSFTIYDKVYDLLINTNKPF